jgi:hypothetical protein
MIGSEPVPGQGRRSVPTGPKVTAPESLRDPAGGSRPRAPVSSVLEQQPASELRLVEACGRNQPWTRQPAPGRAPGSETSVAASAKGKVQEERPHANGSADPGGVGRALRERQHQRRSQPGGGRRPNRRRSAPGLGRARRLQCRIRYEEPVGWGLVFRLTAALASPCLRTGRSVNVTTHPCVAHRNLTCAAGS